MATVSIKQDRTRKRKDGTYPLKLNVAHKSVTREIALDVCLTGEQWDNKRERAIRCHAAAAINTYLDDTLAKVRQLLITLRSTGVLQGIDCNNLRERIRQTIAPHHGQGEFASAFIGMIESKTNARTKAIYNDTWKAVQCFTPNADALQFCDINLKWLHAFDKWLVTARNNRPNTRHIHMRNVRAVLNYALDNGAEFAMPFRRFTMPREETRKRCLSVEQMRHIMQADLLPWQVKYRDVFVLQFCLIGINIVDLLTTAQLVGDRVEYRRAKTHRLYSIKAETEALEIIERYRGEKCLLNVADSYKDYRSFAAKLNAFLKTLVPNCTTYWARHTWATIAASLDVPKETIAHALGHGAHSVTDIYIDFDRRKVDEANRKVIDYVKKAASASTNG